MIPYTPTNIGSGFNRQKIQKNFTDLQEALTHAVSREGTLPNHMNSDLDMNSNDLLNVNVIDTDTLLVQGVEFVPGDVSAKGDRGESATISIGTTTTGAAGSNASVVNVGTESDAVLNFTIPRGNTGASGPGSGDMVAANNLSDVTNTTTAFNNIKQPATTTGTGVIEIATNTEAVDGTATDLAVTPAGVSAVIGDTVAVRLLSTGTLSGASTDISFDTATDYRNFRLVVDGIIPSNTTSSNRINMQVGFNGTDTGNADYSFFRRSNYTSSTSSDNNSSNGTNRITLTESAVIQEADLEINFFNPFSTTVFPKFRSLAQVRGTLDIGYNTEASGYRRATKAINRITLFLDSGTFAAGTYHLYGWK